MGNHLPLWFPYALRVPSWLICSPIVHLFGLALNLQARESMA